LYIVTSNCTTVSCQKVIAPYIFDTRIWHITFMSVCVIFTEVNGLSRPRPGRISISPLVKMQWGDLSQIQPTIRKVLIPGKWPMLRMRSRHWSLFLYRRAWHTSSL